MAVLSLTLGITRVALKSQFLSVLAFVAICLAQASGADTQQAEAKVNTLVSPDLFGRTVDIVTPGFLHCEGVNSMKGSNSRRALSTAFDGIGTAVEMWSNPPNKT